jgi:hypothetical protein
MNVRHLDKRHQGQQQQANERGRAHGPGPGLIHSSDVPDEVHFNAHLYKNTQIRLRSLQFEV